MLAERIFRRRVVEQAAHDEGYYPLSTSFRGSGKLRKQPRERRRNESRCAVVGSSFPCECLAVGPHLHSGLVVDGTELLPVAAKICERVSLTDASDLVLVCYDVDFQPRELLLIARIVEVRVEYSIWRYEYLRCRGQFTGTYRKGVHRLDCIVCKHRTKAVLDRQIPAVEGLMISIQSCKLLHHLYLTPLDRRVAQVVVLVLRPSRAHEHLHSVLCSSIHDRVHRALPV